MTDLAGPGRRRPNVLLILIDDLGYADLSVSGSGFYETPCIDALAASGLRMTEGYAACPVCSPTRASLLTGRYPVSVGITNYIGGNAWGKLMGVPYFDALPEAETTLADRLGRAGYRTWHVGKWHLGGPHRYPERCGFEVNVGGCDWGMPHGGYFSPWGIDTLEDAAPGTYLTDRLTDHAVDLIRQGPESDRPWLLNLCHYAVHTPIQAPAELVEKYRAKADRLGLDPAGEIERGEPHPCLHLKDRRIQRRRIQSDPTYAAMIENLDRNLGRTIQALRDTGQLEDTLVVFTSDNGGLSTGIDPPTCNAPLHEGKGWMYEGGVRVPWILSWPGRIPTGQVSDAVITSPDLLPTLLEVAEIQPDAEAGQDAGLPLDGVSFASVLRGEAFDRGPVFWHFPHYGNAGGTPACSVRDGRWKLIEFFEDGHLELYDLRADPSEQHDLAEQLPDQAAALHQTLRRWRESVEATLPEPNPHHAQMLAGTMPCPDHRGVIPGDDRE